MDLNQLKGYGIDFQASSYEDEQIFITDLKDFIRSYEFMRLGQSINHKQWQAAGMKIQKMSKKAKELGITGWELQFRGLRQVIASKNQKEALQILSTVITKRVKVIEILKL